MVATIIFAGMIYCRGNDDATAALQFFMGIGLALIPTVFFADRLPTAFRRSWLMGVDEDRVQTARRMLLLALRRSSIWFLIFLAILAIQSGVSILHLSSTILVSLVVIASSGLLLWVAARWYGFWSRQSDAGVLVGIFILLLLITVLALLSAARALPTLDEIPALTTALTRDFLVGWGIVPALAVVAALTGLVWCWCIYDGPRGLCEDLRALE